MARESGKLLFLLLLFLFTVGTPTVHGFVLTIVGQANIFKASDSGGGDGQLPPSLTFDSGPGLVLEFSDINGLTDCCGSTPNAPPDGASLVLSGGTNINSSGGISGIVAPGQMFLGGVFVNSATPPSGGGPARLDFNSIGTNFASLSPLLNQAFFIGDGLTGSGSGDSQLFNVPTGADTLILGFFDAFSFSGNPDFYNDNTGSLSATFTVIPEPATGVLMLLGLTLAATFQAKRRRLLN